MFGLRKHRGTSNTSIGINDLDGDTLVEILIRLPSIKHMVSCKLVSKLWFTLISTVCIPRITSSSSHTLYGLLFDTTPNPPLYRRDKRLPWNFACFSPLAKAGLPAVASLHESCLGTTVLPVIPPPEYLLDCYNGVLLFVNPSSSQYYILNPCTQQYIAIPYYSIPKQYVTIPPRTGALIFDPHYKVVQISRPTLELRSINIFDGLTRQWSSHDLDMESDIATSRWSQRSIFFDGSVCRLSHSAHLVKMDVRNIGCCQVIELPKVVVRGSVPIGCLGLSQGSLHYSWSDYKTQVMIWTFAVNAKRSEEWVLKRTLCLQFFFKHPLCSDLHCYFDFSVYAFHPTSDMLFIGCYSGIFSYDPDTKRLEVISKLSEDKLLYGGQYIVFPFSVNLTPLDASRKRIRNEPAGQVQKKPLLEHSFQMSTLDYLGSLGSDLFVPMHDEK